MTARLQALRAQAACLRSWAAALDAQVAEAEEREAREHAYEPAPLARLVLPDEIRARVNAGQTLQRCTKCGCLRTGQSPWRFRVRSGAWSAVKPPCAR